MSEKKDQEEVVTPQSAESAESAETAQSTQSASAPSAPSAESAQPAKETEPTKPVAENKKDANAEGIRRPQNWNLAKGAPSRQTVGIRRINMTISRVDSLSIMKIGFLMSVAIGIMVVVAMMLIWFVLDGMHVFANIHETFESLNSEQLLKLGEYLRFGRWMAFSILIGIIHVVLLTALSAVIAVVYNLFASLVGGARITVTDE